MSRYLPFAGSTPFLEASAEQLREAAQASRQRAEDSFQRCDTDGFLSQWASGLTAQQFDRQAEIAERNGRWNFPVLIEHASGRVVSRKLLPGRWHNGIWLREVWTLHPDDRAKFARGTIPSGSNSRVQKALGLVEGTELAPAVAVVTGSGTGLSGNAWVAVVRRREVEDC